MYHNLLIHSIVDEHLGYFLFGIIMKKQLGVFPYLFLGENMHELLLRIHLEVKWPNHREYACLTGVNTVKTVFQSDSHNLFF